MTKRFFQIYPGILLLLSSSIMAEPWIDTSDLYLKANIQLLADTGKILTPVTTYPLMWEDVINDLKNVETEQLTESEQNAYFYVTRQYKLSTRTQVRLKATAATESTRFTSFGDTFRDNNALQAQVNTMSGNYAFKLSASYVNSPQDGDSVRFDESYIAGFWGNWVFAFGQQDRWFGSFWDTSLSLTNNARPMPAFSITRKSADPVGIPFTDLEVPWTITTFMGKMDDDRTIKDTLLWGFRLNAKPTKTLEFGLSRVAQWGGEGRPQDLSTFWDLLLGRDNCGADIDCGVNKENEPGNQQAGWDMRYSFNLLDTPSGFYLQYWAEDGSNEGGFKQVTKAEIQLGIDINVNIFDSPTTLYFEATDSFQNCTDDPNGNGDCYYEHSTYLTGLRYNGRTISNLYDNDAKTFVLGAISQINTQTHVTTKFRYLDLNYDNSDKAPDNPLVGNPLTAIAEEMFMLSTSIRHSHKNWRFFIDLDVSTSSYVNDIKDETNFNAGLTVEYIL